MGNSPIPVVRIKSRGDLVRLLREQRSRDDERIYRMREAYARGSISLDFFENYVPEVLEDRVESTNDYQVFSGTLATDAGQILG